MKKYLKVKEQASNKGYILVNHRLHVEDKSKYKLMYPQNMKVVEGFNTLKEVEEFLSNCTRNN